MLRPVRPAAIPCASTAHGFLYPSDNWENLSTASLENAHGQLSGVAYFLRLAAFEADQAAALLLDINLPDGSGLDVLREIKRRQPDAVVIMITANVLVDDRIAALRGGAYEFIGKPINLDELQVTIRNGQCISSRSAIRR